MRSFIKGFIYFFQSLDDWWILQFPPNHKYLKKRRENLESWIILQHSRFFKALKDPYFD